VKSCRTDHLRPLRTLFPRFEEVLAESFDL
jgi:hypothetical protein